MNSPIQNVPVHGSNPGPASSGFTAELASSQAEQTLRLIAQLPSPEGLDDRVIAGLHQVPRKGRILYWPGSLSGSGGAWMRGAAAAAIVFVVAGGGWGIYTRVEPAQPARVLIMPRAGTGRGFSSAGEMRTPETLHGPVVARPVTDKPIDPKTVKKTPARVVHLPLRALQQDDDSAVAKQPITATAK
jgi:hypothetical protein